MKTLLKLMKKTIKLNNLLIYFFSTQLFVTISVVLLSMLKINEYIGLGENSENIRYIFSIYYCLIGLTAVFFICYAFNYYIKIRMKDYSLLIILGIKRITLIFLLLIEYMAIFIISCISGFISGVVLSSMISGVFRRFGYPVSLNITEYLEVSFKAFGITFCVFVIAFLIIVVLLHFKNLTGIMDLSIKGEKAHGKSSFLWLVGLAIVIYFLFFKRYTTLLTLLSAMMISVIGIYIVISYGVSHMLLILQKYFVKIFYKNLIPIKEYAYRYKSNKKIMFSVYLINFMVMLIVNILLLSTIIDMNYESIYPYSHVIVGERTEEKDSFYTMPVYKGYLNGYFDIEQEYMYCIPVSDYNRITGNEIQLQSEQCIVVDQSDWGADDSIDIDSICVMVGSNQIILGVKSIESQIIIGQELADMFYLGIIPDKIVEYDEKQQFIYLAEDLKTAVDIENFIEKVQGKLIYSRDIEINRIERENLIILISTIAVGIFSVVCCIGIVGVRSLAELPTNKYRYETLAYLGMSDKMISKNISKEYNILLYVPIILSFIVSLRFIVLEIHRIKATMNTYLLYAVIFQCVICLIEYLYFNRVKSKIIEEIMG